MVRLALNALYTAQILDWKKKLSYQIEVFFFFYHDAANELLELFALKQTYFFLLLLFYFNLQFCFFMYIEVDK